MNIVVGIDQGIEHGLLFASRGAENGVSQCFKGQVQSTSRNINRQQCQFGPGLAGGLLWCPAFRLFGGLAFRHFEFPRGEKQGGGSRATPTSN
jgi:hypothetical protein